MARQFLIALVVASVALACAVASPIQPAATTESAFWFPGWGKPVKVVSELPEGEQFRISHRGSTGFTPVSAVRNSAQRRAQEFCARNGGVATAITEQTSSAPHILGNFPRYEMVFVCAEPQHAVEDPYDRLKRLKELFDSGVISQDEFNREKDELLSR
jgi:hypothetical protein